MWIVFFTLSFLLPPSAPSRVLPAGAGRARIIVHPKYSSQNSDSSIEQWAEEGGGA
jgi:hypothetical protein